MVNIDKAVRIEHELKTCKLILIINNLLYLTVSNQYRTGYRMTMDGSGGSTVNYVPSFFFIFPEIFQNIKSIFK